MTFLTGVLGHPAAHSKSPDIHNKWYKEANLDFYYTKFDVPPSELPAFLKAFKKQNLPHLINYCLEDLKSINIEGLKGLSVTVPHKETCRQFLATESNAVKQIGACNTLVYKKGQLHGHNTDWEGWLSAFLAETKIDFKIAQPQILVFGAGGAAKAVLYALNQANAQNVYVTNRTISKGDAIAKHFGYSFITNLNSHNWDVLINATSLGLSMDDSSPIPTTLISQDTTVYDLIYIPNQLKKMAQQKGAKYINGYQMLVDQAKIQHHLFTN